MDAIAKMTKLYICTLPNIEGYFACKKGVFNRRLPLGKDWDKALEKLEKLRRKYAKTKV